MEKNVVPICSAENVDTTFFYIPLLSLRRVSVRNKDADAGISGFSDIT